MRQRERERELALDDIVSVLQQTGCDGTGVCGEKKIMIA